MIAYFNGAYINRDDIQISPDDRAFLFSDSLYEVIRSYQGKLFRAKEHLERLGNGAAFLRFAQTDFSFLESVAADLIEKNDLSDQDVLVYFQVSRGSAKNRTHVFPNPGVDLTVYAKASVPDTVKIRKNMESGISVISIDDMRGSMCHVKTTGLLANVLASQAAKEAGVTEAVFDRDGQLLEGSHTNFFMVINDVVVTAPLSPMILPGVTRRVVLELCRENNIPVQERPISKKEQHLAAEMFVTSTSKQVTPVVVFDNEKVGGGQPGAVTRRLQELFEQEKAGV